MILFGFLSLAFTRHRTWNQFGLRGALLPATNEVHLPRQTASAKQNIYAFATVFPIASHCASGPNCPAIHRHICERAMPPKESTHWLFFVVCEPVDLAGGGGVSESQNQGISLSDHTAAGPADLEESPTGPGSPTTRRKFTHHSGPPTPRSTLP